MKRLLGYGYTDNKGIATLDYDKEGNSISPSGYEGNSRGFVDIQAVWHEDETIESQQIEITDCIKMDNGTITDHNDIWSSNTSYLSRGNEYSTLTDSTIKLIYTEIGGNIIIEVDVNVNELSSAGVISFRTDTTALFSITRDTLGVENNEWIHIIFEIKDNKVTVSNTTNDRTVTEDITGFTRFYFRNGSNASVSFKNFKVYSIPRTTNPNEINLTSSKNPVTMGETYSLKAFVKGSDGVGSFYPVDFYRGNTKFKTVTADRSGCATVNDLIGAGNGLISYKAKYNNLQSEPYSLLDTLFYESGTSGTLNSNWWRNNSAVEIESSVNGMIIENTSTSTNYYLIANKPNTSATGVTDVEWNDFVCEFTVVSLNNAIEFQLRDSNASVIRQGLTPSLSTGATYKFEYTNNVCTIYKNGTSISQSTATSGDLAIRFQVNAECILTIRDFKIYSI